MLKYLRIYIYFFISTDVRSLDVGYHCMEIEYLLLSLFPSLLLSFSDLIEIILQFIFPNRNSNWFGSAIKKQTCGKYVECKSYKRHACSTSTDQVFLALSCGGKCILENRNIFYKHLLRVGWVLNVPNYTGCPYFDREKVR